MNLHCGTYILLTASEEIKSQVSTKVDFVLVRVTAFNKGRAACINYRQPIRLAMACRKRS